MYSTSLFQYILKLWGEELNSRTEDQKRTMKGKMGSATHTQTVAYLKPLFRKLKQKVRKKKFNFLAFSIYFQFSKPNDILNQKIIS